MHNELYLRNLHIYVTCKRFMWKLDKKRAERNIRVFLNEIKCELTSSDMVFYDACLWQVFRTVQHLIATDGFSLCNAACDKQIREKNPRINKCDLPRCVTHSAQEVLLLSCRYHHQFQIYRRKIHSVWLFHWRYRRFAIDFSAMIFYRILLDVFATPNAQSQVLNTVKHQLSPIWTNTRRISLDFLQKKKKKWRQM